MRRAGVCYIRCMEAALDTALYKESLIVLGAAAVVIPLFHRLRISTSLGFMLVGVAVGPYGFGSLAGRLPWLSAVTIGDPSSIAPIAELGVVLLLFVIGLELSFERLWIMRRLVFGLGALQVAGCATVLALLAALVFGQPAIPACVMGIALAMSSTAVVIQVLSEEKRLGTATGRASFAVLLFQDLSVVPALFALSALAPDAGRVGAATLALAVGQALLAVAVIVALGRLVLRPLFRGVARMRSADFFVAACLLVVIAAGLVTAAAGLSMALGALIGGLLLAGTEYRRQAEVTIEPFKGLFVGVFLISIGMSLDLRILAAHPVLVLVGAAALILVKLALVAPLVRGFSLPWGAALQTGLLLGPGGEFGFVIISIAVSERLLDTESAEIVLFITALTMSVIPLLSWVGRTALPPAIRRVSVDVSLLPPAYETAPRVIIAGFGRVGQTVASLLDVHHVPYVAIDRDPDRVARERRGGRSVYYGDMTRVELLRRLHLQTARALVVTLDDAPAADTLVTIARQERPDLLIIVRARDAGHAAHLYRIGASDAVPEAIEASLQLSEAVLVEVGVPMGPVIVSIHEKRAALQAAIKAMAPEAEVRMLGRRRLRDALQRGE